MPVQSVSNWLSALRQNDEIRYQLVESLRQRVLALAPDIAEEIKYGGILFAGRRGFCGIFSYTNHVTLEFSEGAMLADPYGQLEGKGKGRRHIKFMVASDIEARHAQAYIASAYAAAQAD